MALAAVSVAAVPIVSVVLPAYNAAATLDEAIASIGAQTFRDWEMIVVDDGSVDETATIANAAAATDRRVRVVSQPHAGIVTALNRGVAASTGRLIARMDADDFAHPERLAQQTRLLAAADEIGVASCLIDHGGDRASSLGYALHVDWVNELLTPDAIALNRFVESPVAHPTVVFRRELIERFGGYAMGDFPEDYELWLRWLDAGVKFAKVPRVLLTWNDRGGRLSRTDPRYAPEAFFALKAKWIAAHLRRQQVLQTRGLWIWGAGRPTRKRASYLETHGISIAGYIDVDAKKVGRSVGGRPVVGPAGLPHAADAFILGYVSSRGARELIRAALVARGYVEGANFLMCA